MRVGGFSVEGLSACVEAVRPDDAFLVDRVHRLVARVARHLHAVVLNHVLLDNSVSGPESSGLLDSHWVEVCLWNESVVARDVGGGLGGADG